MVEHDAAPDGVGHPPIRPPLPSQSLPSPPPQSEWESSPIYLALSTRLNQTESTLAALSAQVAQLSSMVLSILPPLPSQRHQPSHSHIPGHPGLLPPVSVLSSHSLLPQPHPDPQTQPQPVFSPFDSPDIPLFLVSDPISSNKSTSGGDIESSSGSDATVAALTQQIAALSSSVAQLQRLQSQTHMSRQPLNNTSTTVPNGPSGSAALSHDRPMGNLGGIGGNGNGSNASIPMSNLPRRLQSPGLDQNPSASLTSPLGIMGPGPNGLRDFNPRPSTNRSFSSSILADGGDKWGAQLPPPAGTIGKFQQPNGLALPNNLGVSGPRDWPSPGSSTLLSPSSGTAVNVLPTGPAAPGAGIVVTKWEHLNLKIELQRSIAKYGIGPPNKIQARVLPFMLKGSDIIAQAPPTLERIISYVIPALQLCLSLSPTPQGGQYRGPTVIIVTTTVDQATQCHKLVRNVGGPLGVRSALAAGASGSSNLPNEIAAMHRDAIQMLIGTPAKLNEVITSRNGIAGSDCRLLILDEVDQLIARNLYENVLSIAKLLPAPRRPGSNGSITPSGPMTPNMPYSPGVPSPYDGGHNSPFNPASKTPFPPQPSRFGTPGPNSHNGSSSPPTVERQTCIFSNTIPTDVINFSQSLQVRDPVRVLVRREGSTNSQESVSSITPGINLKHTYVYLTITGSARTESAESQNGPGTIGSGRTNAGAQGGPQNEEATRAKEYKLDTLVKMLDDYPLWQAIIHVGTLAMLEAVMFKLKSRSWDVLYLTSDMTVGSRKAIMQQWRLSQPGSGPRFLICFDVTPKPPDIPWSPLVINFDLPRSVEGYALRATAAVPPSNGSGGVRQQPGQGQGQQGGQGQVQNGQGGNAVNGVIVSFVQAAGGDVEMLRSTECAYRFKSAEIPSVFHDLFQH